MFGGSNGGPQGRRWPIHGPLPQVRWVEKRKGAFGSFKRVLLVVTRRQKTHFFPKSHHLQKLHFLKLGVPKGQNTAFFWPKIVFHTYIVNFLPKFWGRDSIFMSVFVVSLLLKM